MRSGGDAVCIDIDKCLDDEGEPNDLAREILTMFAGCFVERSASGTGLHVWLRGALPEGCREKRTVRGHSLEIYSAKSARYIAVTGVQFGAGAVSEAQAGLDAFIKAFGFVQADASEVEKCPTWGTATEARETCPTWGKETHTDTETDTHSDEEILALLRQNNKRGRITRLMEGNLSDHDRDHSAADAALCAEIAYYTYDPEQVERIFGTSALAERNKWQQRADYRKGSVEFALRNCKGDYWQQQRERDIERARRGEAVGRLPGGLAGLHKTSKGALLDNLHNAVALIERDPALSGVFGFNSFAERAAVMKSVSVNDPAKLCLSAGWLSDEAERAVRLYLNGAYGTDFRATAGEAVREVAQRHAFDPVVSRLQELGAQWDGSPRIDTWLVDYLGAIDEGCARYVSEIGAKFLIGAVARALRPGCKMDTMLVLEGSQGAGKSQAARVLCEAVYPEGFAEGAPIADPHSSELFIHLAGKWLVELAEMTGFSKADAEHLKAQLSTTIDTGRAKYARHARDYPRRCVFVGTSNQSESVPDASGARRFWSVRVAQIDIAKLAADSPQLWGEAVRRFQSGAAWWITDTEANALARQQQSERLVSDPLDEQLQEHIEASLKANPLWACEKHSPSDLCQAAHGMAGAPYYGPTEQRRLAAALQRTGF